MSGHQSSLLLRKGAVGQAFWPPSRTWHGVSVVKHPKSLDDIEIRYINRKNEYGFAEQDMLRCVNVEGSDVLIYRGMRTMCRDDQIESEINGLSGYRFGVVTSVDGNNYANLDIEFEFVATDNDSGDGLPSRKIKAKGSDLLYWAVKQNLTEADAKAMMGVGKTASDSEEEEEQSSNEEGHNGRPARKRQAASKFDPSTYTVSPKPRRVIQDNDKSSSGEDSFYKELFPESDSEEEESGGDKQGTVQGRNREPDTAAWGSPARTSASSWGTPATSHGSTSQGSSSWGVAMSSESNDSPSGWGHSASAVTPDNGHGWGRSSSSANSSRAGGWGRAQSSGASESNTWHPTSPSSALQYRKMPESRSTRIESKYLTQSKGVLEVIREADDDFFLRWYFGSDRVKVVEVGLNQFETIERTKKIGGELFTLVVSKYEQGADEHGFRSRMSKFGGRPYAKSYYVSGDSRSVQKEINGIANFSDLALTPGKLASRLELLVSNAAVHSSGGEKTPYMFKLPASDIEEIDCPENRSMGCGFIPGHMLEELLGSNNDAKDAIAIQCRIICPTLGIFKGELVKKAGISKIQLPSSMKKVGKSTSRKKSFEGAFLIINSGGICPSQPTRMMERAVNRNPNSTKRPTKTSEKELRGIDNMMKRLLLGCGASEDALDRYNKTCNSFAGRNHAYLTGVCDCTDGGIPPGTVFLTGFGVGEVDRTVFITRSPCTERRDAAILKVVSQQPDKMSDENWDHLCHLPFGSLMFASPSDPDAMSLPESINNSDLDGDRFFCLWEPTLLPDLELKLGIGVQANNNDDDGSQAGQGVAEAVPEADKTVDVEEGDAGGIVIEVEDVLSHRGKGRNAEVEVLAEGGKRRWVDRSLVMAQMPEVLAEYALQKNLYNVTGWRWARQYIHNAEIVEVKRHRFQDALKTCQVEVLYDGDPKTTWINARSIDVDILAKYVEEKGVSLQCQEWQWLARSIEKEKKQWFKTVQLRMANIKHVAEHNRFVTKLHGLHGKYAKEKGIGDNDSIAFGRAYKNALDVCKHGGRVALPRHLREEVAGKKGLSFTQFLKDSPDPESSIGTSLPST